MSATPPDSARPVRRTRSTLPTYLAAGCAILIVAVAWLTIRRQFRANADRDVVYVLTTVVDTTHYALERWFDTNRTAVLGWSLSPLVLDATKTLLAVPNTAGAMSDTPAQAYLQVLLTAAIAASSYQGWALIGPDDITMAGSATADVGHVTLLSQQPDFLKTVWSGTVALSAPQNTKLPLLRGNQGPSEELPAMFIAAPIKDEIGKPVAIVALQIDPRTHICALLRRARLGRTGDTYAIDTSGNVLSEGRFSGRLDALGLPKAGYCSFFGLQARDPGPRPTRARDGRRSGPSAAETRPLTRMAAAIALRQGGLAFDGYRDYRGVDVVGAWRWSDRLGVGIAAEQDLDEAYDTFTSNRRAIDLFGAIIIALIIWGTIASVRQSRWMTSLNHVLERKVYERTRDLSAAQSHVETAMSQFRKFFDLSLAPACIANTDGRFLRVNSAFANTLGYSRQELTNRLFLELVHPDDVESTVAEIAKLAEGLPTIDFQNRFRRADGTWCWLSWTSAPATDGALYAVARDVTAEMQTDSGVRPEAATR